MQGTGHLSYNDIIGVHLVVYAALLALLGALTNAVRSLRTQLRAVRTEVSAMRIMVHELWREHFPTPVLGTEALFKSDNPPTNDK